MSLSKHVAPTLSIPFGCQKVLAGWTSSALREFCYCQGCDRQGKAGQPPSKGAHFCSVYRRPAQCAGALRHASTQLYNSRRSLPQRDESLALGQHLGERYCSLCLDTVLIEAARGRGKQVSHPVQVHAPAGVPAPNGAPPAKYMITSATYLSETSAMHCGSTLASSTAPFAPMSFRSRLLAARGSS